MFAHDFDTHLNLATDFDGTLKSISIRRSTGIGSVYCSSSAVEDCILDPKMVTLLPDTVCFSFFMAGTRYFKP